VHNSLDGKEYMLKANEHHAARPALSPSSQVTPPPPPPWYWGCGFTLYPGRASNNKSKLVVKEAHIGQDHSTRPALEPSSKVEPPLDPPLGIGDAAALVVEGGARLITSLS